MTLIQTSVTDFRPLEASAQTLRAVWVPKATLPALDWLKAKRPSVSLFGM